MRQGIGDHLIQELVAANAGLRGPMIDLPERIQGKPHGNHFFFLLLDHKWFHKATTFLLHIVFYFDKIEHIQKLLKNTNTNEGKYMAESYKELYLHLFRETEKAIRILQKAQADCEELFLQQEPTVLTLLPQEKPDDRIH